MKTSSAARDSWQFLATVVLMIAAMSALQVTSQQAICPIAFWNFGDSLTDTGGTFNVFPRFLDPERRPYGEFFFGRPAKRWCNGRVVPDFFVCSPFRPFLPLDDSYSRGLYTVEIGGNDIINSLLFNGRTPAEITTVVIPAAMINIANGIQTLYENGARQFIFFNAPNAGCSTIIITLLGTFPRDSMGCVLFVNELDQVYNAALNATIATARLRYGDAHIDIFNYYAANDEILRNPTRYGFNPALTQTACCGANTPGLAPLNYNPLITCGAPGATTCSNPDEYVNWDGVHFTEAFYRVITRFVLDGRYTDLGFNYTSNCNLNFRNFGRNATFEGVYGNTCRVTFLPS